MEGSFFTECELSSGDDENGDAFAFRDDVAESQALHFVMCEVLLAIEGQAPVDNLNPCEEARREQKDGSYIRA